jgi:sulfatase modifying factor 1
MRISVEIVGAALAASLSASCGTSNGGLSASSVTDGGGGSARMPSTPSGANCSVSGEGTTNCGSAKESCCTSLEVMGGTYNRTYTNAGDGGTDEADPATISSFRLDKYPVTVGRFRPFVAAVNAGWTPPAGSGKHTHLNGGKGLADSAAPGMYEPGWVTSDATNIALTDANLGMDTMYSTWTPAPGNNENLPINELDWYEAFAFCVWDGGFLPSEAEWEYASAGGSQQREYPWGATDPGTANQYAIYDCYYPNGTGTCAMSLSDIAPVGSAALGAGIWGQLDLVGEMAQWILDLTNPTYVDPCTDCAYLTATPFTNRVIRGGGFSVPASALMSRDDDYPPNRNNYIGFRCARTPS